VRQLPRPTCYSRCTGAVGVLVENARGRLNELIRRNLKSVGNGKDVRQRGRIARVLDAVDGLAINTGCLSQLVLGKSTSLTELSNLGPKLCQRIFAGVAGGVCRNSGVCHAVLPFPEMVCCNGGSLRSDTKRDIISTNIFAQIVFLLLWG
jgi:hypothetical protein